MKFLVKLMQTKKCFASPYVSILSTCCCMCVYTCISGFVLVESGSLHMSNSYSKVHTFVRYTEINEVLYSIPLHLHTLDMYMYKHMYSVHVHVHNSYTFCIPYVGLHYVLVHKAYNTYCTCT